MNIVKPPLPKVFIEQSILELGKQHSQALVNALDQPPPVSIRLNPLKVHKEPDLRVSETLVGQIPWAANGFYLGSRPAFISDPFWHAGYYYVQEASSMALEVCWRHIQAQSDAKIRFCIDACAAPGGKSTHLLSLMDDEAVLLANEIHKGRVEILKENISRWGYENVIVTNNKPEQLGKSGLQAQFMLVDAPCSGEGMFRKDPNSRSEWSEQNVVQCANRQSHILNELIPCLAEGGYLLYSTCTFNRKENEEQVTRLISRYGFEVQELPIIEDYGFIEGTEKGCYRALPDRVKGEGFFFCLLRKKGELADKRPLIVSKSQENSPKRCMTLLQDSLGVAISIKDSCKLVEFDQQLCLHPAKPYFVQNLVQAKRSLKVVQVGLPIGHFHRLKQLNIDYELLWSARNIFSASLPTIPLSLAEVIKQLRGEAVHGQFPKGYAAISYLGHPLFLAKSTGNRLNSKQKKSRRIKKHADRIEDFCIFEAI